MPTQTYIPLANLTLSGSAASVTFSSISQAFRDVVLVCSMSNTVGNGALLLQLNGDTGGNYNWVRMYGDGSSTASSTTTGATSATIGNFGTNQSNNQLSIMDYSTTDKHKSVLSRTNDSAYIVSAYAARWASTSAVTSFVVYPAGNAFAAGSTFALYGIAS